MLRTDGTGQRNFLDGAADITGATDLAIDSDDGVNVDGQVARPGGGQLRGWRRGYHRHLGRSDRGSVTTDGVAITGVSTVGGGVTLVANSPLTINEAVADTGGGDITLTASGTAAADDLNLAANVTASGGDGTITLDAGDAILQTAGTVSAAGAGTITYNAATGTTTGVLTMSSGTQIISATGTIDPNADGDIQLAQIDTTSGNVTVTSADGSVTLSAGEGGIVATSEAGFILEADAGITLNDVLTTVAARCRSTPMWTTPLAAP